jgi:FHA domain-containing protein
MRLVIRAQKLNHDPLSQAILGEFDERGGTIGRSDSNTMTLPDPERHVSRLQAEVTFAAGSFSLRNVGGSNPIIVNGHPVGPGEGVALRHQDQLLMGSYELRVDLQTSPATRRPRDDRAAVDPRTVISASAGEERTGPPRQPAAPIANAAVDDPFADLLGAPAAPVKDDPFADLLSPASPTPRARKGRAPAQSTAAASPRSPDDFDPFENSTAAPREPGAARVELPDQPLSDLLGPGAATPGIDTMFGLKDANAAAEDAVAGFLGATDAPPAQPAVDDPLAFLQGNPPTQSHGPASADHTPALQAEFRPPPIRSAEPARVPPPAPRQPAPQEAVPHDELWAAFCEGAQVSPPSSQRLTPELMRAIGSTLRHAVEGTVQLNMMRATVKQELHVAVTVIKPKGNNPLKFAPDATAALMQILQPPMRGFMSGPEAMQDAMNDLIGHSLGTMEGTRAALHGVLERFQPAKLEAQLASGGMLDRLVPMNRRAHLWELYLKHYGRITESAREDFDELFGKAFAKAYEEHAQRVSAARRVPG